MDATAGSGLEGFRHFNAASGKRYEPEIIGSGVALFDHDGDGHLDALLLDGWPFPGTPPPDVPPHTRLFRNDGRGRFEDVTGASGLEHAAFAMGAAVGDVDGDGDPDLLITHFGPDVLYRNDGGVFTDVTREAGVGDARWTASAAFLDYDRDGDLDLYVTAYLDLDPERFEPCSIRGLPAYCGPDYFPGLADRLYRNDGGFRFSDVSREAGIAAHVGKGLGVVAGDIDDDGDVDLYVANDATPNLVLVNQLDAGRATFVEEAVIRGAAYGETARAEAGMGTDMADVDGDGDLDVVVTNLENETYSLYRNEAGFFMETSFASGLGATTLPWVGFGVRLADFDLDGELDLVATNGHILDNAPELRQGARFVQPTLFFRNTAGAFSEACDGCLGEGVGRGLAVGDVDNDGDLDLLISQNGRPPKLFRNVATRVGDAVGLRLEGAGGSNRDAYNARLSWPHGTRTLVHEVRAAGSFCSSSDPRALLAVPKGTGLVPVTIRWPDGGTETWRLAPGAYHHVVQGRGVVSSRPFAEPR